MLSVEIVEVLPNTAMMTMFCTSEASLTSLLNSFSSCEDVHSNATIHTAVTELN